MSHSAEAVTPQKKVSDFSDRSIVAIYAATLFLSAFLLFSIQPFFAKMVLPRLGGSSGVWSVAMVFFQAMLLLGYGYAHVLTKYLNGKTSCILHLGVMLFAFVALPIALPAGWDEVPRTGQSIWLIGLFTISVGLPFFAVSANGPLLQAWFSRTGHEHAKDPYFLYGASNVGSFASLFVYILVLEPVFTVTTQSWMWTVGFAALLVSIAGCGYVAMLQRGFVPEVTNTTNAVVENEEKITIDQRVTWVWLAAIPSALLVAVTSFIVTDIASAPFLWVIPLALFLLTFVIVFQRNPIIPNDLVQKLLAPAVMVVLFFEIIKSVVKIDSGLQIWLSIILHFTFFFVAALAAHGSLAARRPSAKNLTEFYFLMSVGGLIGGIFASLVSIQLFPQIVEYPLLVVMVLFTGASVLALGIRVGVLSFALLICLSIVLNKLSFFENRSLQIVLMGLAVAFFFNFAFYLWKEKRNTQQAVFFVAMAVVTVGNLYNAERPVFKERSFFGVTTVGDKEMDGITYRLLVHGSTVHGAMKLIDAEGNRVNGKPEPLTYYYKGSPMERAISETRSRIGTKFESVGVIGLGTGSLACHKKPQETWDFYEIDQLMIDLAVRDDVFGFVSKCAPDANMIVGDARLTLKKKPASFYDVLIVDAFSSNSIPVHLLTTEAISMYMNKLKGEGVLAMHISNRYMELQSVVEANAKALGLQAWAVRPMPTGVLQQSPSLVMYLTRSGVEVANLVAAEDIRPAKNNGVAAWTDDYSNVLSAILRK